MTFGLTRERKLRRQGMGKCGVGEDAWVGWAMLDVIAFGSSRNGLTRWLDDAPVCSEA